MPSPGGLVKIYNHLSFIILSFRYHGRTWHIILVMDMNTFNRQATESVK